MSFLAQLGTARSWLPCVAWLGVSLCGCGGTDVVARLHREPQPCSGLDASCGEDAALPELDAGTDAEAGLDAEAGRDADTAPDSDAGADSDAGQDAAMLSCRARVCGSLGSADTLCRSSGPAVLVGDHCETNASVAPVSRYALCSCTDLVSTTTVSADAFADTLSRPVPNAAAIGVNEDLDLSGTGNIDGEVQVVGRRNVSGSIRIDAVSPVTELPCSCEPTQLLDIPALVLTHKRNHDNAREGLNETSLDGFRGTKELTLPCGRYYFTRLKSNDPLTIHTHGNVAIFVEENIELGDSLSIQTDDDLGQVDLFVAGEALVGGALRLGGDPNGKARANLYLQSGGTLQLRGSTDITGNVYAPHAELVNEGIFQLYGSLFVKRAAPAGELHLHYDTGAAQATQCE